MTAYYAIPGGIGSISSDAVFLLENKNIFSSKEIFYHLDTDNIGIYNLQNTKKELCDEYNSAGWKQITAFNIIKIERDNNMSLYIFVDNTRKPLFKDCIWAKDYDEAIAAIESNAKDDRLIIDLDHDLGPDKTGYDLAEWLVKNNYTGDFRVHSMYPAGQKHIRDLLKDNGWREFF